jgi:plastocyanin
MIKNLFIIPFFLVVYSPLQSTVHEILVWDGYMQFMPSNLSDVKLGDTIEWLPLDIPTMVHTITSTNIPIGATPFDQIWQTPLDTFFQYIPDKIGLYEYVCTPHIANGMIGSFTVQETNLSITNNPFNINHAVFPNPTNNYIQFSSEFKNLEFFIYEFSGRLVLSGISSSKYDISKLNSGIYYLVIAAVEPEKIKFIIK